MIYSYTASPLNMSVQVIDRLSPRAYPTPQPRNSNAQATPQSIATQPRARSKPSSRVLLCEYTPRHPYYQYAAPHVQNSKRIYNAVSMYICRPHAFPMLCRSVEIAPPCSVWVYGDTAFTTIRGVRMCFLCCVDVIFSMVPGVPFFPGPPSPPPSFHAAVASCLRRVCTVSGGGGARGCIAGTACGKV